MSFDTATKEAAFTSLRTGVGAATHYLRIGADDATAVAAILKASTRRDAVTGAGLDSQSAGRALVKTSDYSLPDNRKIWVSRDGTTYAAARIQSVQTLADAITAIEYDSINRATLP